MENGAQFDPILIRWTMEEEKDFTDKMRVCVVVPTADAAKKGAESCVPDGSWRTRALMISGGSHKSFAVEEETGTSTSLNTLTRAVIAHEAQVVAHK